MDTLPLASVSEAFLIFPKSRLFLPELYGYVTHEQGFLFQCTEWVTRLHLQSIFN